MTTTAEAAKNMADFLRGVPKRVEDAMVAAANEYAGNPVSAGGSVAQGSEGIVGDRFRGAGNKRFASLSPAYAAWKQVRYGKKPILVRSGALMKSIIGHGRIRSLGNGVVMVIFTVPEYGLWHQAGGKHLPRRSPVDPDEGDKQRVQASFAKHYAAFNKRAAASLGITVY